MASLNFKGKSAVWNHHLSVPYHTLESDPKRSLKGENVDENLIIEGDNLLALKSLLPKYQGTIKRIYIDPPYNTGEEKWVYNDKVNSPMIREWVGEVVGKQGEDLTRHDKWLCMMAPRLKLLRELLADDGIIYISIDDNESHNLQILLNEVFFEENFLARLIWRGMHTVRNSSKDFNQNTEFVFVYARNKSALITQGETESYLRYPMDKTESYPYDDDDGKGAYKLDPLHARNFYTPYVYKFRNGTKWEAPSGNYPRYSEESLEELDAAGEVVFKGDVLKKGDGSTTTYSGESVVSKRYLKRVQEGVPPSTLLLSELVGFNKDGTAELAELFNDDKVFNQPKPTSLIKWLMRIERKKDDKEYTVLDSFAGSGSTAQAVLDLNKEDGGNRKFILIQIPEEIHKDTHAYEAGFRTVPEITCERVKRAIKKHGHKDGFTYSTLGPAIDAETLLSGSLPTYNEFAKYVYYLATGKNHPTESKIKETDFFVGDAGPESIYLVYEKDMEKLKKLAITLEWAQGTHKKDSGKKIVYAPACFLDDEALEQYNIKFVSIPYNLFERTE